jgi:hypothetical protein
MYNEFGNKLKNDNVKIISIRGLPFMKSIIIEIKLLDLLLKLFDLLLKLLDLLLLYLIN